MTELSLISETLTMTSREIAELVEARHDNVKRTVERCAESGVITLPPLEEVSNTGPGPRTVSVYTLDKRSSMIVVAQMSPEFTARMYDRWQELEAQAKGPEELGINPELLKELIESATNTALEQARVLNQVSIGMLREDIVLLDDFCRLQNSSPETITARSIELLKAYGKHHLVDLVQRHGTSPDYDQHQSWKAIEDSAQEYADEVIKARKTLNKKPLPILTPEQAQAVADNWRVNHLPYSLVYDTIFTTHYTPQEQRELRELTPVTTYTQQNLGLSLQQSTGKTFTKWDGSSSLKKILANPSRKGLTK